MGVIGSQRLVVVVVLPLISNMIDQIVSLRAVEPALLAGCTGFVHAIPQELLSLQSYAGLE